MCGLVSCNDDHLSSERSNDFAGGALPSETEPIKQKINICLFRFPHQLDHFNGDRCGNGLTALDRGTHATAKSQRASPVVR